MDKNCDQCQNLRVVLKTKKPLNKKGFYGILAREIIYSGTIFCRKNLFSGLKQTVKGIKFGKKFHQIDVYNSAKMCPEFDSMEE